MNVYFNSHDEELLDADAGDADVQVSSHKHLGTVWYDGDEMQFTTRLLRKQEEERHDVAKELQDTIAQLLIAAQIHLDHGQKASPDPHPAFADARKLLTTAMQEIRSVVNRLYPHIIEHYGTMAALQFMCTEFSRSNNLPIRCMSRGATRTQIRKTSISNNNTSESVYAGIMLYRGLQLVLRILEKSGIEHFDNVVVIFITQQRQLNLRVVIHHYVSLEPTQELFTGLRSYIRATGGSMRLAFFTDREIHLTMHVPLTLQPVEM